MQGDINSEEVDPTCSQDRTHVEESEELLKIVSVVANEGVEASLTGIDRLKKILEKYQEQAQLLDPYLPALVEPLASKLRELALVSDADSQHVMVISRALWAAATTRGSKAICKFFPNEARDVEPVIHLLARLEPRQWEAQCVLLLWLSQLVLIPFDLAIVDSSLADAPACDGGTPPLVAQLIAMCQEHLRSPGSAREMAARVLGRLLTRPDSANALAEFLKWVPCALRETDAGSAFLVPGTVQTLNAIFQAGPRKQMIPVAESLWPVACRLYNSTAAQSSVTTRKQVVKLVQRMGLVLLPPRLASWRYRMRDRALHLVGEAPYQPPEPHDRHCDEGCAMEDEVEIPPQIEEVVGMLLEAVGAKDTVVRWSAAKGLGRITDRLPQEEGDQVVRSVMAMFSEGRGDTVWHGACLALAELARRGLLLPERLPAAVPLISRALLYDVRRGAHSVGAHVRDAAAYVCWAIARAYTPDILEEPLSRLAPVLLTAACYDREVNCRRAASAAFQEGVGRVGSIPHGITVLGAADYFAIAARSQAYLGVAPFVAGFEEYRGLLSRHLLEVKLAHWDRALRTLASQGLAALVPTDTTYFATEAVDFLVARCVDPVLEVRHGAALGLGEVVLALHACGEGLAPGAAQRVAGVVAAVDKARLYRGKGGELMRGAISRLIECCSKAELPLSLQQQHKSSEAINENLRHPNAEIRAAAAAALRAFASAYWRVGSKGVSEHAAPKYMEGLLDANVAVRRGYAMALGALPCHLLLPHAPALLPALAAATQVQADPEERDAEGRAEAVKSIAAVVKTIFAPADVPHHVAIAVFKDAFAALLSALDDYSTDNRGDVGSWVREAAMAALLDVLRLLPALATPPCDVPGTACAVAAALAKQGVERIGRLREAAITHLRALLELPADCTSLPFRQPLVEAISEHATVSGGPEVSHMARLLLEPALCESVLEGLAASVGGLDTSLAQAAGSSLMGVILEGGGSADTQQRVADKLIQIWQRKTHSARMAVPLLRTAALLLSQQGLSLLPDASAASFHGALEELVREEVRGCRDVGRLCCAADVACCLISTPQPTGLRAADLLLSLLGNKYPKVRRHTAEQLYVQLLAMDTVPPLSAEATESLREALSGSAWDGPREALQEVLANLYHAFQLEPPAPPSSKAKPLASTVAARARAGDEECGYQSLLLDAARC
eukprot:jgi/Botrbrau1/897/Bobra.0167s0018.1